MPLMRLPGRSVKLGIKNINALQYDHERQLVITMSNIRELLEQAKNWEIHVILDEATKKDIPVLALILPQFLKHRDFGIRATALEVISGFQLKRHLGRVVEMCEDKHPVVQTYALSTYYDLRGKRALPKILEYCTHKTVRVRIQALSLAYVITRDVVVYLRLREIVIRNRSRYYNNQSVMFNTFEDYLKTETYPEIIELYKKVLKIIPKHLGVAKGFKIRLNELGS